MGAGLAPFDVFSQEDTAQRISDAMEALKDEFENLETINEYYEYKGEVSIPGWMDEGKADDAMSNAEEMRLQFVKVRQKSVCPDPVIEEILIKYGDDNDNELSVWERQFINSSYVLQFSCEEILYLVFNHKEYLEKEGGLIQDAEFGGEQPLDRYPDEFLGINEVFLLNYSDDVKVAAMKYINGFLKADSADPLKKYVDGDNKQRLNAIKEILSFSNYEDYEGEVSEENFEKIRSTFISFYMAMYYDVFLANGLYPDNIDEKGGAILAKLREMSEDEGAAEEEGKEEEGEVEEEEEAEELEAKLSVGDLIELFKGLDASKVLEKSKLVEYAEKAIYNINDDCTKLINEYYPDHLDYDLDEEVVFLKGKNQEIGSKDSSPGHCNKIVSGDENEVLAWLCFFGKFVYIAKPGSELLDLNITDAEENLKFAQDHYEMLINAIPLREYKRKCEGIDINKLWLMYERNRNSCWLCPLFARFFDIVSFTSYTFYLNTIDYAIILLGLGFLVWFLYKAAEMYLSGRGEESGTLMEEVFNKAIKIVLIAGVLYGVNARFIYKYTIDPIMQIGASFSTEFLNLESPYEDSNVVTSFEQAEFMETIDEEGNRYRCPAAKHINNDPGVTFVEDYYGGDKYRTMSQDLRDTLICAVEGIIKANAKQITIAQFLLGKLFRNDNGDFSFLPNMKRFLTGGIMLVVAFLLNLIIPFMILKYILYIGMITILLPVTIVGYAFDEFKQYLTNAIGKVISYSLGITFTGFGIAFYHIVFYSIFEYNRVGIDVIARINNAFSGMNELSDSAEKSLLRAFNFDNSDILIIVFMVYVAIKVAVEPTKIPQLFGFDTGDRGESITDLYKNAASKIWEKTKGATSKVYKTISKVK
jgi:hypothetical protein